MVLTSTTDAEIGTDKLKDEILQHLNKMTLVRDTASSFVMAIDHCFSMRGSGAICTGTIITGQVKLNDVSCLSWLCFIYKKNFDLLHIIKLLYLPLSN